MKTIVHLLRHGEVHNPEGVLYGQLPGYHLSDDGRVMAEAAAKWLAERDVTVLCSSPMERAQETAEPIAAALGLPVGIDERLIEGDNHASGHEGVCVSHQLPIWVTRLKVEGRRLWHHPGRRQCGLASVTSVTYDDGRIVKVDYAEPAGEMSRRPGVSGA